MQRSVIAALVERNGTRILFLLSFLHVLAVFTGYFAARSFLSADLGIQYPH